jgi:HD-like signal output (HDOD) protein
VSDFLQQAPTSVDAWAACFEAAALPVLDSTALALEDLREIEDHVDAHLLAETVRADPLLTLKLFAHVAALRRSRRRDSESGEPETVLAALVLLGIPPFFAAFGPQPTVGQCLAGLPEARAGFDAVLHRAGRAAQFATAFAVHRMDHDAEVIREAALLHDFAELLLWQRFPALALRIAERQRADPTLRSGAVQRELLNIELNDLQHRLMASWGLPELLVHITDEHAQPRGGPDGAQLLNVRLAIRVARHSAHGWDNAALPDDVREIADLLQMGIDPVWRLLRDIDGDAAPGASAAVPAAASAAAPLGPAS